MDDEYPAGRFPPDPYGERPTEGWFAGGDSGKRWNTFVMLSDGATSRRVQTELGVDGKTVTLWVKKWRAWWPGVLPGFGPGRPGDQDVVVPATLDEIGRQLGVFESVPGRSLGSAAVVCARLFSDWAEGLTDEAIQEWTPTQAVQVGRLSGQLMKAAFEMEKVADPGSGPAEPSSVTNALLINIDGDASSAEKLGQVLDAWNGASKKDAVDV